ncbi:universal stress protein [Halomicrobium urmianum]|uniref:universal stress protein n=1 Tax=Halomicrobium urmianum TaxID=1586233 RepID=UPI001CD9D76C|nr:universal stress protein [Halomicrobium urmianum]
MSVETPSAQAQTGAVDRVVAAAASEDEAAVLSETVSAVAPGATVHALYVVDTAAEMDHFDPVVERAERRGEAAVDALAEALAPDHDVVRHFRYGGPGEEITAYAADHDADMVVVGNYRRTGLDQLKHGASVVGTVRRRADVPVLAVPVGSDSTEEQKRSLTRSQRRTTFLLRPSRSTVTSGRTVSH